MTIDIGNSNNGIPVGDVSPAQGGTAGLDVEVVTELPQTGEEGILYLVPVEDASGATNTFKEYIWLSDEDRYEELGYTDFDITSLEQKIDAKQNKLEINQPLNLIPGVIDYNATRSNSHWSDNHIYVYDVLSAEAPEEGFSADGFRCRMSYETRYGSTNTANGNRLYWYYPGAADIIGIGPGFSRLYFLNQHQDISDAYQRGGQSIEFILDVAQSLFTVNFYSNNTFTDISYTASLTVSEDNINEYINTGRFQTFNLTYEFVSGKYIDASLYSFTVTNTCALYSYDPVIVTPKDTLKLSYNTDTLNLDELGALTVQGLDNKISFNEIDNPLVTVDTYSTESYTVDSEVTTHTLDEPYVADISYFQVGNSNVVYSMNWNITTSDNQAFSINRVWTSTSRRNGTFQFVSDTFGSSSVVSTDLTAGGVKSCIVYFLSNYDMQVDFSDGTNILVTTPDNFKTHMASLSDKSLFMSTITQLNIGPDANSYTYTVRNMQSRHLGLSYDDSTLKVNDSGQLYADAAAPTNMVTTDTEQTITGAKTFNVSPKIPNGIQLLADNEDPVSYEIHLNDSEGTEIIQYVKDTTYPMRLFNGTIESNSTNKVRFGQGVDVYVQHNLGIAYQDYQIYDASMNQQIGQQALPSVSSGQELTLPASTQAVSGLPTTGGYIYWRGIPQNAGEYMRLIVNDSNGNFYYSNRHTALSATDTSVELFVPIPANCQVVCNYTYTGATEYFRFIPTQGSSN